MVSLNLLDSRFDVSADSWRRKIEGIGREANADPVSRLEHVPTTEHTDRLGQFIERMRDRVRAARSYNMEPKRWHHFAFLDQLWGQAKQQVTPTLLSRLAQNYSTEQEAMNALQGLGFDLTSVLVDAPGAKDDKGQPLKTINVPAFYQIFVGLMPAYLQIRRAKLVNERNVSPMIKYKPVANTKANRLKAEILTSRVDLSCRQFNGIDILDQSIFNMLLYQYGIAFPRENWYSEKQARNKATGEDAAATGKSLGEDLYPNDPEMAKAFSDLECYTVREGIRRHFPHPSRSYWDKNHRLRTLNTDTGCEYCGNMKVVRFKDLKSNPEFYNLDRVTTGGSDWWTGAAAYLNSFMGQCVMDFPRFSELPGYAEAQEDRETWLAQNAFYESANWGDKAVIVFDHFEKFIPREVGLGTYPYPIWGHFVLAGDGTVVHASPLGYRPALVNQDRGNENLLHDASLAMRAAPFQDMMTNLLTQYLLAVKQNLTNLTLVEENIISKETVGRLQNLGHKFYTALTVMTFDSRALRRGQHELTKAIYSHRFPTQDTTSLLQGLRVVTELMERILQFSSQEVAQAASHEQTVEEIQVIQSANNNILAFTGMGPDEFLSAMGAQEYEAGMNYWEDDLFLSISRPADLAKSELEKMGITLLDSAWEPGEKRGIKASKSAMLMDLFVSVAPLHEREIDAQLAQAMTQFFQFVFQNPKLEAAIGTEQAIVLANAIAQYAKIPLPEPLKDTGDKPQPQVDPEEMTNQVIQKVLQIVKQGIEPVQEAALRNKISIDAIRQHLQIGNGNANNPNIPGGSQEDRRTQEMAAST